MTATSISRMVVPFVMFAAACGVALVFAIQHVRHSSAVDPQVAIAALPVNEPASGKRDQVPATLAAAQT